MFITEAICGLSSFIELLLKQGISYERFPKIKIGMASSTKCTFSNQKIAAYMVNGIENSQEILERASQSLRLHSQNLFQILARSEPKYVKGTALFLRSILFL